MPIPKKVIARVCALAVFATLVVLVLQRCKATTGVDNTLRESVPASDTVGVTPTDQPGAIKLTSVGHGLYQIRVATGSTNAASSWSKFGYRVRRAGKTRAADKVDCQQSGMTFFGRNTLNNKGWLKRGAIQIPVDRYKSGQWQTAYDKGIEGIVLKADPTGQAKVSLESFDQLGQGPMIVEACLMEGGQTVAAFRGELTHGSTDELGASGLSLQEAEDPDIHLYAEHCKEKLGPIRGFDGSGQPTSMFFDCQDPRYSMDIPIHAEGQLQTGQSPRRCDKPVYLGGMDSQCLTHSRIGRLPKVPGFEDTDTVFICRRYEQVSGPEDPNFSDVAIVQHNSRTGATCWFQMLTNWRDRGGAPRNARKVPAPDNRDPAPAELARVPGQSLAQEFWLTPQDTASIRCFTCHDSDAFMHSPYVDAAVFPSNAIYPDEPVVPRRRIPREEQLSTAENGRIRYWMVNEDPRLGFGTFAWQNLQAVVPPQVPGQQGQDCVSCHRIGTHRTCGAWTLDSIGEQFVFSQFRTAYAKNPTQHPELVYWMPQESNPPNDPHSYTRAQWTQKFAEQARFLKRCCENTNASGCRLVDIPGAGRAEPPPIGEERTVRLSMERGDNVAVHHGATSQGSKTLPIDIPSTIDPRSPESPLIAAFPEIADEPGTVKDLELEVTVAHDNWFDLEIRLVAPDGSFALARRYSKGTVGGPRQQEILKFKMSESPLRTLQSAEARGRWRLDIWDPLAQHSGKLVSAKLTLKVLVPQTVQALAAERVGN